LKYQFIKSEKKVYPITLLCKVMKVPRTGYYRWANGIKSARQLEYERLRPLVKELHNQADANYGARRIAEDLTALGEPCGRTRAATLMKIAQVEAKHKKRFKVTTNSAHKLPVAPNLLERDFATEEPDRVYVGDITYIWTREGWLYLAIVLDLYSRKIVGWSMSNCLKTSLVADALKMAIWRRSPDKGLIFHSDRGSQYCSKIFQKLLKSHKMKSSMSKKGDCWDNAVAESFFGSLKTERVNEKSYQTREEARRDVVDYIEMFYNSKRRHSYLGYLSPKDFEELRRIKKAA
jgi:putative transposase